MKIWVRSYIYSMIIVFSIILAWACNKESKQVSVNPMPSANCVNKPLQTYLALGDSYTIGQNVGVSERFPYHTASILSTKGFCIKDPQYIATTGWTTSNLLSAIGSQNPQGPFDIVSLLIGVNDQYQRMDTAGYRTRFTQLLNKAVELAGNRPARVFVLSIPDYSATPFVSAQDKQRVRTEIDQFNVINKQVTLQNDIAYIDITALSREAANDSSLLADDGLHYSGKEHKKWAELLAAVIEKEL